MRAAATIVTMHATRWKRGLLTIGVVVGMAATGLAQFGGPGTLANATEGSGSRRVSPV